MIRVAINGYGRMGRNILRACYERPALREQLRIVAINELGDASINAHLTRFDSVHGHFSLPVEHLLVDGDRITVLSRPDPAHLPWGKLEVDVVCECTGPYTSRDRAVAHIAAGARKVLVSAPGKDMDATIFYGVNHSRLRADDRIVSNGSCTTNCLAPLARTLHDALRIESGFMTTVHSYTNDQQLSDGYHRDPYRARPATQSMIPTKIGAASAIGLVIPELEGRLDGLAVRVPTVNVSLIDLTFVAGGIPRWRR